MAGRSPLAAIAWTGYESPFADEFPFAMTRERLEHGRQQFDIFCAVCHSRVGDGKGMIPQRGFTPPPNFHTDDSRGYRIKGIRVKLRNAPVGYYFHVITNGYGAMPDYASQVPVHDRWEIVAYIRVLQYSQAAPLADVGAAGKKALAGKGGQP